MALLVFGTVVVTLAGIDTGTAFGGMGASREVTILALVEPTALLVIFATHRGRCRRTPPASGRSAGALLLTAVLVLWRRELAVIVRVFALQGVALAGRVAEAAPGGACKRAKVVSV